MYEIYFSVEFISWQKFLGFSNPTSSYFVHQCDEYSECQLTIALQQIHSNITIGAHRARFVANPWGLLN